MEVANVRAYIAGHAKAESAGVDSVEGARGTF